MPNNSVKQKKKPEDEGETEGKKPKKIKKIAEVGGVNTLESNLDNISVKKFDLGFDVDPLFKKTSAAFDEAGAKGLLLNHLSVYNNCEIIFDSSDAALEDANAKDLPNSEVDVTELKKNLSRVTDDFGQLELCPTFSHFKFNLEEDHDGNDDNIDFNVEPFSDDEIPDAPVEFNNNDDEVTTDQREANLMQEIMQHGQEDEEGQPIVANEVDAFFSQPTQAKNFDIGFALANGSEFAQYDPKLFQKTGLVQITGNFVMFQKRQLLEQKKLHQLKRRRKRQRKMHFILISTMII